MRTILQRVSSAQVVVDGEVVGSIGQGLVALVGVTHDDGPDEVATHEPRVVFVDGDNRIVERGTDPAHAPEGSGLVDPRDG